MTDLLDDSLGRAKVASAVITENAPRGLRTYAEF